MNTEGGKQRELLGTLGPTSASLSGPIVVSRMSTHGDAELWGVEGEGSSNSHLVHLIESGLADLELSAGSHR